MMSTKIQARKKMNECSQPDPAVASTSAVHSVWGFALLAATLLTPGFMMVWEMREPPSKIEAALADAPYELNNSEVYCRAPGVLERKCHVRLTGEMTTKELSMPVALDAFPSDYSVELLDSGAVRVKTSFTGEALDFATAKSRLLQEVNATAATYLERKKEFELRAKEPDSSAEAKARNLATYP
jgi:hypothetical protein